MLLTCDSINRKKKKKSSSSEVFSCLSSGRPEVAGAHVVPASHTLWATEHAHSYHYIRETGASPERQIVICGCQTRQKAVSVKATDGRGWYSLLQGKGKLRASFILKPVAFPCPGDLATLGWPVGKSECTGLEARRSGVVTIKINSCD